MVVVCVWLALKFCHRQDGPHLALPQILPPHNNIRHRHHVELEQHWLDDPLGSNFKADLLVDFWLNPQQYLIARIARLQMRSVYEVDEIRHFAEFTRIFNFREIWHHILHSNFLLKIGYHSTMLGKFCSNWFALCDPFWTNLWRLWVPHMSRNQCQRHSLNLHQDAVKFCLPFLVPKYCKKLSASRPLDVIS